MLRNEDDKRKSDREQESEEENDGGDNYKKNRDGITYSNVCRKTGKMEEPN